MKQSHAASVWSQLYECKMPLKGWHSMVIRGQDYSMLQVLDRCYAFERMALYGNTWTRLFHAASA